MYAPVLMSWLPLLALGCSFEREDFIIGYATAYCDWLDDCGKIQSHHGTYAACITKREIDAGGIYAPSGGDCSFDEDKAVECIDAFGDLECQTSESDIAACREVSNCDGAEAETEPEAQ
jgi:hypothetical protein